jgi:hypothetical protein
MPPVLRSFFLQETVPSFLPWRVGWAWGPASHEWTRVEDSDPEPASGAQWPCPLTVLNSSSSTMPPGHSGTRWRWDKGLLPAAM